MRHERGVLLYGNDTMVATCLLGFVNATVGATTYKTGDFVELS